MRATESSCIAPSWTSGTVCVGGSLGEEGAEEGTEGVERRVREMARMSVLDHTPDQIMIYCYLFIFFCFLYSPFLTPFGFFCVFLIPFFICY